jgi:hypothetical protein
MIKQWSPKPRPPNTDQLRHAIDSGRTGDKVDAPDPAAAPLGTDSEAAGAPPLPNAVRTSMRAELQHPRTAENQWSAAPVWYVSFVVLIAIAGIVLFVIFSG